MSEQPRIWTDTPPKEPGVYLVRGGTDGKEYPIQRYESGLWEWLPFPCQFGPRIPSAEELAGLYAAANELAELKRTATPLRPMPYTLTDAELDEIEELEQQHIDELDQLRAAAAELAEIKRAWGVGDTKGGA
jgi:hypothetical protein